MGLLRNGGPVPGKALLLLLFIPSVGMILLHGQEPKAALHFHFPLANQIKGF